MSGIAIVLIIVIALYIYKGTVFVEQGQVLIIERLGKYHKTLNSGIHLIVPFIDVPKTVKKDV